MAIVSSDINYRYSGGSSNSNAAASLGGVKSSVSITSATLNNLFDNVTGDEASSGDTEYRCLYIHNAHATITWESVVVWIDTNTPSTDTTIEIALGSSAVSGTEQTIANESAAPTGVTFSAPASKGAGLSIGNLVAGASKALWIKRIVSASASAYNTDSVILRAEGDTSA
jgi:hypothetical protein